MDFEKVKSVVIGNIIETTIFVFSELEKQNVDLEE
jgi:hypothetical protein